MTANEIAFLAMISHAEGTDRPPAPPDSYRTCYGYHHVIQSFADHPAMTGEWTGEMIGTIGIKYRNKVSTAAGRYQIIKPTWLACKTALRLPDFSPASQDRAALFLIAGRGARADVNAGAIAIAIQKCRNEWASLPGGDSGQPQRTLAVLLAAYRDGGGKVA